MSKQVIVCRGLPGSGKSSWAKEFVSKNPNSWKRINLDELRAMFDNSHQSKGNEKFVKAMRDLLIIEALKDGKNVISDNTHLSPKSVNHIRQLVQKFNKDNNGDVQVEEKFFDVPVEECIKRDLKRPNSVGQKIIMEMYNLFLAPKAEPLIQDRSMEKAILVDIDGTVAEMIGRGPFEWKRVGEDYAKTNVISIISALKSVGYKLIFFSGRDSVCREETLVWLNRHLDCGDWDYELYMRPEGDNRKDSIIKKEMFDKYIRNKYYIEAVFDDRLQVCRMWHNEIGLQLFRVGNPDADF